MMGWVTMLASVGALVVAVLTGAAGMSTRGRLAVIATGFGVLALFWALVLNALSGLGD